MFQRFYLDKENIEQFNSLWIASDIRAGQSVSENVKKHKAIYLDSVAEALQIRLQPAQIRKFAKVAQQAASDLTLESNPPQCLGMVGAKNAGANDSAWVVTRLNEKPTLP